MTSATPVQCSYHWSRGRYSTEVWVGRCGWGTQTLTLFKTEISYFPTLFETEISYFPTLFETEISYFPTLFETEISDFPTVFKIASIFLRPRLNTFNQISLSSFVVVQASGISANVNKKGYKFGFLYHFYKFRVRALPLNVRIPC